MDKININIGSVVKANVGYIEDKTKEGASRSIHKEVTWCVQAVPSKNKLQIQFKYGQSKKICTGFLIVIKYEEGVEKWG